MLTLHAGSDYPRLLRPLPPRLPPRRLARPRRADAAVAARARAGPRRLDPGYVKDEAVVLVFLGGGASHIETFNPNMDGPEQSRSITGEVKTTLPGVTFGGTFPHWRSSRSTPSSSARSATRSATTSRPSATS